MSKSFQSLFINQKRRIFFILLFCFGNICLSQTNKQFSKSERRTINTFPNDKLSLKKIIGNKIYGVVSSNNLDSLIFTEANLSTDKIQKIKLNISSLNCNGIIDFYINDSFVFLLSDNGSRIIKCDKNSKPLINEKVANLHSNLFKYTSIHVDNNLIFLLYTIDMSSKTNDRRNLFIDRFEENANKLTNIFSYHLNANFFLISSYRNWTFDCNNFYFTDIIRGNIYYVNLLRPNEIHEIHNSIFDKDSNNLKRIEKWENNYTGSKTLALLDSIRNFYANEYSTTWITSFNGIVTVIDKLPGDSCNANFRSINIKTGENNQFTIRDYQEKCLTKPYLNLFFVDDKKIIQFFNFYDPNKGQVLSYYEFSNNSNK